MRKNTPNEKVLRAISIGLAAMIAVQPVMATPVLADDLSDGEHSSEDHKNEESKVETKASEAVAPVQTATEAAADVTQNISSSFAKDVEDTVTTSVSVATSNLVDAAAKETVSDNKNQITETADLLSDINTKVQAVDDVFRSEETDAEKAEAEKLAESIDKAMEKQSNAVNELNDSISKADVALTVIAGNANITANEIKDVDTIEKADEKLAAVADAKAEAEKIYEAEKANYDLKASEFHAEEVRVKELADEYNKLLDDQLSSESNLMKAKEELEQANEKLASLKSSLEAAQKELSSEAVARLEKALTDTAVEGDKANWDALDVVFEDIIKYYYLPSQGIDASNVTIGEFYKPKDSSRNYLEVIITNSDGSTDTRYFNYKRPDESLNSYKSIVIFEKNDAFVDSSDKIVSVKDAVEITADGVKEINFSNKVIKDNENGTDIYYKAKSSIPQNNVPSNDSDYNADGEKKKYEKKITNVESVIVKDDNGNAKLVETVTGSITTITTIRENVSLNDITKVYDTEDAANKAKQTGVNSLIENQLKQDGNYKLEKDSATYTTSVDSVVQASVSKQDGASFSTTINLNELSSNNSKFDADNKASFISIVEDFLKNNLKDGSFIGSSVDETKGTVTFTYKNKISVSESVSASTEEEAKEALNIKITGGLFDSLELHHELKGSVNGRAEEIIAKLNEGTSIKSPVTVKTKYQLTVSDINCNRLSENKEVKENTTLKQMTYNLDKLTAKPILNDNFTNYKADESNTTGIAVDLREGKINSSLADKALEDIKNFNELKTKYAEAAKAAETADNNLDDAIKKLQTVIDAIEDAKLNIKESTYGKLAQLELQLKAAENSLDACKEQKDKAEQAYENAAEAYKEAVNRINSTNQASENQTITDETAGEDAGTSDAGSIATGSLGYSAVAGGSEILRAEGAGAVTASFAETPAAGAAEFAAGVAGARVDEGLDIVNELSGKDGENNNGSAFINRNKKLVDGEKKAVKTINDEEVPLASFPDEGGKKMSWWWLIIIALLGATGEEMYRRKKLKEEQAKTDLDNNK